MNKACLNVCKTCKNGISCDSCRSNASLNSDTHLCECNSGYFMNA